MSAEALANGPNDVVKIRAHAIHLVDETNARHAVLVRLTPDGLGLRLHASYGVKHAYRAVQNAQRPFHFDGEVHVARRINDVDAVFLAKTVPRSRRRSAGNRDAALALLLHPIHGGGAFIHGTNLVGHTGIEQNPLRRRRFTGVDVRHDSDVPRIFEFENSSHDLLRRPFGFCSHYNSFLQSLLKLTGDLPAIVCKRLVRFRHAVYVFFLLDRSAARIGRINQLVRELVDHRFARALP